MANCEKNLETIFSFKFMKKVLTFTRGFFSAAIKVLTSKRFKAFYWGTATMALAGFLDLISQEFINWNPDSWTTAIVGLIFAQITKAMNNKSLKEME